MDFKPNDASITSESAPLIEPVDCESDHDLFMVPLKRPSPRLPPSRYRNVKARSPPRSPAAPLKSPQADLQKQLDANPYQSPPMSGRTIPKPDSPPMFTSPLMSPDSGELGLDGSLNPQDSLAQRIMATPGSLVYNSPPMSGRATKLGSSPVMSTEAGSARQSPQPGSSAKDSNEQNTTASRSRLTSEQENPSTQASSVYDSPPTNKPEAEAGTTEQPAPPIPPISQARGLLSPTGTVKPATLGLALHLANETTNNNNTSTPNPPTNPNLLAPPGPSTNPNHTHSNPKSPISTHWTVPDSPLERLSQLRATPDSAYDRARQMEVRRSEWKHVVYRFPVKGAAHWVIDADLTESSHARLADVARRSSEGFEFNGDYELANIYRVLSVAHTKVMEEMREERRGVRA